MGLTANDVELACNGERMGMTALSVEMDDMQGADVMLSYPIEARAPNGRDRLGSGIQEDTDYGRAGRMGWKREGNMHLMSGVVRDDGIIRMADKAFENWRRFEDDGIGSDRSLTSGKNSLGWAKKGH